MRRTLLGSACALALSALFSGTALADVNGFISGDYSNLSGSGANVNSWGGNGAIQLPIGTNFGIQADTGYHTLSGSGTNVNLWNFGGVAGWTGANSRFVADVRYYDFSSSGSEHYTSYGVGGEVYLGQTQSWTLGVNGGGISGAENGSYFGGAIKYYPCPRFAASGAIDYTSFGSHDFETSYGVKGEFVVVPNAPFTVYAGYSYVDYSGGDHANLFTIGAKFYIGDSGAPANLATLQRTGEYGWIANGPGAFNAVY